MYMHVEIVVCFNTLLHSVQNVTNPRCVAWDFDLEGMHSVVCSYYYNVALLLVTTQYTQIGQQRDVRQM